MLGWTHEYLVNYHIRTGRPAENLNPFIKVVLAACPGSRILGRGADSVLIEAAPNIVAKVGLEKEHADAEEDQLKNEQEILELLGQQERPCPFLIQSYFVGQNITFLEYLPAGTLHGRIRRSDKPRPTVSWMLQLASAVAHLEALGYAHGDINPQNVLVDDHDQLRLIDFGYTVRIGKQLDVGYEPYIRQGREEIGGGQFGMAGMAGPGTEQFALGSMFWYMVRGEEAYSEVDFATKVNWMYDGSVPETNPDDPVERIIGCCWQEQYVTVANLVQDIQKLPGAASYEEGALSRRGERETRKKTCEELYRQIQAAIDLV